MSTETLSLPNGELIYGLVVTLDIEAFSKLGFLEQSAAQGLLEKTLTEAATAAGLSRADWYRQLRGDGELAVLPPAVDVASVVADFTDHLVIALREVRSDPLAHPKLRIRVAMHHGTMTAGLFGPVGATPIIACRLLDARVTKAALTTDPTCDLVLVISPQLYDDVVVTRFRGLDPGRFRPIREVIKGRTYTGHLCLGTPKAG